MPSHGLGHSRTHAKLHGVALSERLILHKLDPDHETALTDITHMGQRFDFSRKQEELAPSLHRWSPRLRTTYRHPRWRLDTTLGIAYVLTTVLRQVLIARSLMAHDALISGITLVTKISLLQVLVPRYGIFGLIGALVITTFGTSALYIGLIYYSYQAEAIS